MGRITLVFPVILFALLNLAASQDAEFWNTQAKATLAEALGMESNRRIAKNVIFFLGDGMDITTTTAARILRGQLNNETGEEGTLSWDSFPHVALSKTYNTDAQVADSAGTATAFFCGVKSKQGTVGLDDRVVRGNCSSTRGAAVDSILKEAHRGGKATGVISTARVTHATPAATYASSPDRNWESDGNVPAEEADLGCKDIALQLVEDNPYINVILGGGRRNFLTNETVDPEYAASNVTGVRTDGKHLVNTWLEGKESALYVWNQTAFDEVDVDSTSHLLGLFEPSHMKYEFQRLSDTGGEPSIAEMTEKAINMLSKDRDGYFLMVEGGRIDHGHHDGKARVALMDTIAFHDAVAKAIDITDSDETLIVVTADHGHVITLGGYPSRGNPLFGYDNNLNGSDGLPYLTLTYANGPGGKNLATSYNDTGMRANYLVVESDGNDFIQDAAIPLDYETHGGTDVAVYAHGPWAHLFHGTREQNYIAHVVRYAACYAQYDGENACSYADPTQKPCPSGTSPSAVAPGIPVFFLLMLNSLLLLVK